MHLIVWTVLGEQQQQICRLFKVDAVVSKTDGVLALSVPSSPWLRPHPEIHLS